MNVAKWIRRFAGNTAEEEIDWEAPLEMSDALWDPLAIFQFDALCQRAMRTYLRRLGKSAEVARSGVGTAGVGSAKFES